MKTWMPWATAYSTMLRPGEIEHVIAVQFRWHHQQRMAANGWRGRPVLKQLENLVAVHDGPWRSGQLLADRERCAVDHARHAAFGEVADHVPAAA